MVSYGLLLPFLHQPQKPQHRSPVPHSFRVLCGMSGNRRTPTRFPASSKRILNTHMIRILGTIFAGLLGLAFGSFLNVCLSRWPEGESVVKPRSHCRNCDHTLAWWENIPLLSWIVLRGRCRKCG